jgi:hypothetical protein
MTTRPRNVREDAKKVLANALPHLGQGDPEYIALGLLAALDGAHIGLTDTTPPVDPNADALTRPTHVTPAVSASSEYQQAKAALAKNRPTAPRGAPVPARCGCGCVRGFCQCAGDPCACTPCPLCHPAPEEPQESQQ